MAAVTDRLAPTVVTEVRNPDDVTDVRYRARTYLTLRAAERAVLAAWSRGQRAEVVLVRLVPVQIGGEL
ncbi:hypothetical protein [Kineococcus sp. R86509]|uniref:hypothetical protein n=1 Tax=Kineococcus sp. R86509 TaxID=3093851 RepID=UPI0036D26C79